ncbi:effector-associated domain 2-containing protein [Dactylosporangium sp. CA-092794]|uniref:VMAP-C domain-containing protein n=1 Tax=Dactylosporangium sp. CA-092794 TaxID=3239929 RepID=UPI003D8F0BA6
MTDLAGSAALLAKALGGLYAHAGRPTLASLVKQGETHRLRLSVATLSDWLHGKSVPADRDAFAFLVAALEKRAAQQPGHQPREPASWLAMRDRAWSQKQESRRDRASGPAAAMVHNGEEPADRIVLRLTQALHRIASLHERSARDAVLDAVTLRLGERLPVRRVDGSRLDLIAIVEACAPRRGGVAALAAAVGETFPDDPHAMAFAEVTAKLAPTPAILAEEQRTRLLQALRQVSLAGVSLPELYEHATEFGEPLRCAQTMLAVVAELETHVSPYPLFAFVELVAGVATRTGRANLHSWVDEHLAIVPPERHADLRRLRDKVAAGNAVLGRRTHVLVKLSPVRGADLPYRIQSWMFVGVDGSAIHHEPDGPVSLEQARTWFAELVAEYGDGALADECSPMVEFLLTDQELDLGVDSWLVPDGRGGWVPAGVRFVVVVRPDDRDAVEPWRRRWQVLKHARNAGAETVTLWVPESAAEKIGDIDLDQTWALMAVTCPEASCSADTIASLLRPGTPVALWVRGSRDLEAAQRQLTETITAWEVNQIPERVRGMRQVAWAEDQSRDLRDLVLVWDDPTRLPPVPPTWSAPRVRAG